MYHKYDEATLFLYSMCFVICAIPIIMGMSYHIGQCSEVSIAHYDRIKYVKELHKINIDKYTADGYISYYEYADIEEKVKRAKFEALSINAEVNNVR
jgi:hypothetical protein